MENPERRTLSLCGITYQDVLREILATRSMSQITTLKIINSDIAIITKLLFNGFENLQYLEISKCLTDSFEANVFDTLTHLQSINFNDNIIAYIDKDLLSNNHNLSIVILKNNILSAIDKIAFSNIKNLQILDLSYNNIKVLDEQCLHCPNLTELYLNNNKITEIKLTCFELIVNLTHLSLDGNHIERLEEHMFKDLINLKHLNLSSNSINYMHNRCFSKLTNLSHLSLRNNFLIERIDKNLLTSNTNLIDLDLSNNNFSGMTRLALMNCKKLKFVKLMVFSFFMGTIKHLQYLTKFELVYKGSYLWTHKVGNNFKNLILLTKLKLIFQKIFNLCLCGFSKLKNLKYLHIECIEPIEMYQNFDLRKILNECEQLTDLVIKKMNYFTIYYCNSDNSKLQCLNLSGIKNTAFPYGFLMHKLLTKLDLSFSQFEVIEEHTFENLVQLESLNLEFSKLKYIKSTAFKRNRKLRDLNCAHCRLETIEDNTFFYLSNLKKLNLSDNPLTINSENVFNGLNQQTCSIIL